MRIDAHHHVWDLSVREQDWIQGDQLAPLLRDFSMQDLEPELEAAGIDGTVLVQTVALPDETPEFLDIAGTHPAVVGVVGWLDLEDPDARGQLNRYRDHPHGRYLVGIRDLAEYKEDAAWLEREDVVANLRMLGDEGITYDLLTRPPQLPAAVSAVRACPDTTFVLDHLSKPDIAAGAIDNWARDIAALAALPNVSVKVSGMFTEATWDAWTIDTFRPYVEVLLATFGPSRMLFGSDWPVSTLAATYQQLVETTEALFDHLGPDDRALIWSGTATRVYGL